MKYLKIGENLLERIDQFWDKLALNEFDLERMECSVLPYEERSNNIQNMNTCGNVST